LFSLANKLRNCGFFLVGCGFVVLTTFMLKNPQGLGSLAHPKLLGTIFVKQMSFIECKRVLIVVQNQVKKEHGYFNLGTNAFFSCFFIVPK
jgi:hypothetical protein